MATRDVMNKKKAKKDASLDMISTVEQYSQDQALNAMNKALDSKGSLDFEFGGILSVIQANDYWVNSGYESFKDFVTNETGLKYRKAMYLIGIYNTLVTLELPFAEFSEVGWTKMRYMARILTKDNYRDWIERAKTLTVLELQQAIEQFLKEQAAGGGENKGSGGTSNVSTMTFKVFEDQKEAINEGLDMAIEANGDDDKSKALTAVCVSYMESLLGKPADTKDEVMLTSPSLKVMMSEAGYTTVFELIEELWPNLDITVEINEESTNDAEVA